MTELLCNLHIHSKYSDGSGDFLEIMRSAYSSGLDVIITTDHNVLVSNSEGYFGTPHHKVLHLVGEEVHDQTRNPQHNHALVIGCPIEAASHAGDPQGLINFVKAHGGLIFLAHPFEKSLPLFHEEAITWISWDVENYTGIELWNGFSEFKTLVHNLPTALFYAFFPRFIPHRPLPEMLEKWSELLSQGKRVSAVAGSDSHALLFQKGLFKKTIFPYEYHFTSINNHLLVPHGLTGNLEADRDMVFTALSMGSNFIAADGIASARGFSFTIENDEYQASQGETMVIHHGATLKVTLPSQADVAVYRDQACIFTSPNIDKAAIAINEKGAYRVEVSCFHLGKKRGWIYSNPIYIRKSTG